jgi:hypothetical protein
MNVIAYRPAIHHLWLVPGLAIALVANAQAAPLDLGLVTVLAFGIVPHLPVLLGIRRSLPTGAVVLFNAMHEPAVPLVLLVLAAIGGLPPVGLVAALAWLSHIVIDWGMGDGLRGPHGSGRRHSFLEGRPERPVPSAAAHD